MAEWEEDNGASVVQYLINQYGFRRVMIAMNGPNADLRKVSKTLSATSRKVSDIPPEEEE